MAGSDCGTEREKRLLIWLVRTAENGSDSDSLAVSCVLVDEFDDGRDALSPARARVVLRERCDLTKSWKESWASRAFISSRDDMVRESEVYARKDGRIKVARWLYRIKERILVDEETEGRKR